MKRYTIFLLAAAMLLCGCSGKDDPKNPGNGSGTSVSTEVPDKEGFTVKGMVLSGGKPLYGVIVSDGRNVTMTDFDGRYWLRSSTEEDFVWVSIPSGYEVSLKEGWHPEFYRPIDQDKVGRGEVQRFDFTLTPANQQDFRLVVFTDVHIRGLKGAGGILDKEIFRNSFLPKMQAVKADTRTRLYGIVLGDHITENSVPTSGSSVATGTGLPEYKETIRGIDIPLFDIPGNHDCNGAMPSDYEETESRQARSYYREHLGPTYYSFSIGDNHFVMLDGTQIKSGPRTSGLNEYSSLISPHQLDWMEKDLSRAAQKGFSHIVICCHQPFYRYGTSATSGAISNRDEVMTLCKGFSRVTVLSGHIHVSDIARITLDSGTKVRQYTLPQLAAAGYRSSITFDGSPCGYTVFDFAGSSYTRTMRAYDDDFDTQVRCFNEDGKIVINVPGLEDDWTVKVKEGSLGSWTDAKRVTRTDPLYTIKYTEGNFTSNLAPTSTYHIFEYTPKDASATICVQVTDSEGRIHTQDL